jgi:Cu(I)/Ag(I) efflux system membrane fusion protein
MLEDNDNRPVNLGDDDPLRQKPGVRIFRRLAWWGVVIVILVLLVVDPFHVSPVGRWVRELLGHDAGHVVAEHTGAGATPGKREVLFYRNPMDPTITSPVPAKDSMGMDYVPVYADEATPAAAPKGKGKILFYRNPMDPTITSPVPTKDSMGMDYVPVYASEAEQSANEGATVTINPVVVQDMNVQTEQVLRRDLTRQIRTVGYLDYDQEKMVSVTTKYNGYLEKVFVNYLGQPVEKGQPLFEIYSPELVQTEQELISTLDYVHALRDAPPEAQARAKALLTAVRARLAYWDITRAQIEKLEQTRKVFRRLTVFAPASGVVMMRMPGLEGMAVKPGMELLHIANISTLWLTVQIYEDQLPWVNVGSRATVSLDYLPGERFVGRVRYIEPSVSEKTRTLQVTLEVPNPQRRLRAGMYATVLFEPVVARNAIVVPTQAILRTGERNLVIVALGGGQFAPRDITLGPEGDGYAQVLAGLSGGERIVTSAQFLIDSESNLREAVAKMVEAKRSEQAGAGHAQ